ncbi:L-seryl-tRNA(Sec) selenium transferase [candidate division GN15 bacterium]|nr:L-seryl-tRNA(Sec) selenium transferase [candidate division GN15 bacterium]
MAQETITSLREFPSIEELTQSDVLAPVLPLVPRPVAVQIVRDVIAQEKERFRAKAKDVTLAGITAEVTRRIERTARYEIGRVINATGIVVHTNLGRAPLSDAIFDAIKKTVTGYGNIEFDLYTGARGKRGVACEHYLAVLSGAEAATVVNNCAAGLFLTLNTLANRKGVLISRGELVQIGGGFRIPDILRKSGARLCEVGSTNITTLADYEAALDERTGMILKVHKSNFVQAGFTEEVALKDLVALGQKQDIPVFNDLGSGVFIDTRDLLGYHEPTVQQSVAAGADVTSFSGDKLLGGSQAGLLVGRAELINRIKKNPIFRTMRVDKITFSIIERLLTIYLNGSHLDDIALWRTLALPESTLYRRGKNMLAALGNPSGLSIEATRVYIGGGALPQSDIPSVAITFDESFKPNDLLRRFRKRTPPIIGRIENDRFMLDLKAIDEVDLATVRDAIEDIIR